ncbi:MAG: tRNA pseudouridine(55) synthase TruB [Flavobacteriales bacterium]|nr:tRNA pseudouridine(55) synthase TruB [Flavobacteriales bacterium]
MPNFIEGEIILVDKPLTWTSFDVVNKIKYSLKRKLNLKKIKVGHAGTLDPLASGLLIVCTGKKTKAITEIQAQVKEYTGVITLGATTPSFDLETEPENFKATDKVDLSDIISAAKKLTGKINQTPPIFSAKKIDGKRAYDLARKGKTPEMRIVEVEVYDFEITNLELPEVHFRVTCSKGTYIRTLANDLGELLKTGAYLKELRRTKIGEYAVSEAYTVEKIIEEIQNLPEENY